MRTIRMATTSITHELQRQVRQSALNIYPCSAIDVSPKRDRRLSFELSGHDRIQLLQRAATCQRVFFKREMQALELERPIYAVFASAQCNPPAKGTTETKSYRQTRCGAAKAQHSTAQHSTAQHSTAQHSTAQHSTAPNSTAQHSTAQHSTAQHSTAQHSKAQQSTAKHSTAQYTAQHSTAQHSTYHSVYHIVGKRSQQLQVMELHCTLFPCTFTAACAVTTNHSTAMS